VIGVKRLQLTKVIAVTKEMGAKPAVVFVTGACLLRERLSQVSCFPESCPKLSDSQKHPEKVSTLAGALGFTVLGKQKSLEGQVHLSNPSILVTSEELQNSQSF
jgi:hypothetical protein